MREKIVWMEVHAPEVIEIEDTVKPEGFELVRITSATDRDEHLRLLADAEYIIAGGVKITDEYMAAAPKLKMIQKWGVGVDKIDCQAAARRGIKVCRTAGANAIPVAEMAMALMFAANRMIPYVDQSVRQGKWIKADMRPRCRMIHGKRIGLLGIGNIAREVAKMLRGFSDTEVVYYDIRRISEVEEKELDVSYVTFEELLCTSDILSVHVPLLASTFHMIGEKELASMKKDAILINTARGGVVAEDALVHALKNGIIRGAGLDSFEQEPLPDGSPLRMLENVVLSCHCGGGVADNVIRVTKHAFSNIEKFSRNESIDPVDCITIT